MTTAQVTSTGISLPLAMLEQLGMREGDSLQVTATQDGVTLRKVDPVVEQQMAVARQVMNDRFDVLRRLAE